MVSTGECLLSGRMKDIKTLVLTFADRLQEVIETDIIDRARAAVLTAMGIASPKRPGRPPKAVALSAAKVSVVATKRRKAPLQLCPVPGCKNAAAPVFGMVCAKHTGLPKATIKKYREARRLKKLKATEKAPAKARGAKAMRQARKVVRMFRADRRPKAPTVIVPPSPAPTE